MPITTCGQTVTTDAVLQFEIAEDGTVLQPGDHVLAILQPGKEDELRCVLLAH